MLYIFRDFDTVIGAIDGPPIDMEGAYKTWQAENNNPGPQPQDQASLKAWYAKCHDMELKLHEKYGSIPQQGYAALWMKVLVKDFKYVQRKEFEVFPK